MTREQFELPFPQMPRLTHFGYSACVQRYEYGPHFHFGYEFVYIIQGSADIELFEGENPITLKEDDLLIISPKIVHQFKFEQETISFFWVGFQVDPLETRSQNHMHSPLKLLKKTHQRKLEFESIVHDHIDTIAKEITFKTYCIFNRVPCFLPVFSSMYEELHNIDSYSQQIMYQKILELFTRTARLLNNESDKKASSITYIREYLDSHCRQQVDLGKLALKAGYTQEHASRAFKKLYHISPKNFHDQRRLQVAKEQLSQGASVSDTATHCGFSSSSYFSSWFSKITGVSPQQYQKMSV